MRDTTPAGETAVPVDVQLQNAVDGVSNLWKTFEKRAKPLRIGPALGKPARDIFAITPTNERVHSDWMQKSINHPQFLEFYTQHMSVMKVLQYSLADDSRRFLQTSMLGNFDEGTKLIDITIEDLPIKDGKTGRLQTTIIKGNIYSIDKMQVLSDNGQDRNHNLTRAINIINNFVIRWNNAYTQSDQFGKDLTNVDSE
ncbi:hypothetical protein HYW87_03995 [Candidatus Roizmanbacteria bacterium]|nr:hypothetical protein [Candidatus Roizmanbacteria bacterium]